MGRFVKKNNKINDDMSIDDLLNLNTNEEDNDPFDDDPFDNDTSFDNKKSENNEIMNLNLDDDIPNSDLSLSTYKMKDETTDPGKKKLLIVLLIGAALLSLVAIGSVGYLLINGRPPACKTVHIESDNIENQSTAKYGSMITLKFSFNKDIQGKPTVIIQDRQVEVYGKGKDFYAKYFVQNPGTEDEVVKFIIKDYKDSFNRKGSPVTTTTDLSRVVILAVK